MTLSYGANHTTQGWQANFTINGEKKYVNKFARTVGLALWIGKLYGVQQCIENDLGIYGEIGRKVWKDRDRPLKKRELEKVVFYDT